MSQTHKPHPALRVEADVLIDNAKARSREHMLRETHVRVGDHPPEPRVIPDRIQREPTPQFAQFKL